MVGVEVAVERILEPADLGRIRTAPAGPIARITFAGDQRGHHRPPGHSEDVGGHHRELDAGVLKELSTRFFSAVRTPTRSMR